MGEMKRKAAEMQPAHEHHQVNKDSSKKHQVAHESAGHNYQNCYQIIERGYSDMFADEALDWFSEGTFAEPGCQCPHDGEGYDDNFDYDEELLYLTGDMSVSQPKGPPSPLSGNHARSSPFPEEYEPKLQHSSASICPRSEMATPGQGIPETQVDWEPMIRYSLHRDTGSVGGGSNGETKSITSSRSTLAEVKQETVVNIPSYMHLRPFKTFLNINDLINAKIQMFSNSGNIHFELFARIVHSSRDDFNYKQSFKFGDLLNEAKSILPGTLTYWRDSRADNVVLEDLLKDQHLKRKCYCRFVLVQDEKSEIGWSAVVEDVQLVS